jgi:hypothetical protein
LKGPFDRHSEFMMLLRSSECPRTHHVPIHANRFPSHFQPSAGYLHIFPKATATFVPGQQLNYGGHNARNRTHVYIGTRKRCGACAQKAQCTTSPLIPDISYIQHQWPDSTVLVHEVLPMPGRE